MMNEKFKKNGKLLQEDDLDAVIGGTDTTGGDSTDASSYVNKPSLRDSKRVDVYDYTQEIKDRI